MAEWQAAPDDATNPPGPATPATPPLSPDTTLAEATPRRAHTALSDADSTCVSQSEDERSARHVAGPEKSVAFAAARRPQRGIANVVERSWRQANANALRSAQPGLSGLASSSRLGNAAGAGELVGVGGLQERTAVGGSEESSRNHSPATVSSASEVDQPMVVKRTASLSGASPPPPPPAQLRHEGEGVQMRDASEVGLDLGGLVDICKHANAMHAEVCVCCECIMHA